MKKKQIRIIPKLEIKNNNLIKTIFCEGLRVLGDPKEFAKKYYLEGADELLFLDNVATLMEKKNVFDIIKTLTEDIFIPITIGGGLRNIKDIELAFKSGADKISLNTSATKNINILKKINNIYGNQAIVMHIQTKLIDNTYYVFTDGGRQNSQIKLLEWINSIQKIGIGEIVLTSIDREGTEKGFDLKLLKEVKDLVKVPLILSGGFGNEKHIIECLKITSNINGFALASMLHYKVVSLKKLKMLL
jgi:cyclase